MKTIRKIQMSKDKKSFELLTKTGKEPLRTVKTGLSLEQALKESANIGYKNLYMDILKKK